MPSTTITASGSNGHHTFDLYVNETATSTANNTSTVAFTFSMRPTGYDWYWSPPTQPVTWNVTINGVVYSGAIYTYDANTALTIRTGSQTVAHNANGTKTIDISFSVSSLGYAYLPGSASANGTLTLTAIARYPSVTQAITSRTETSLTVKWSSDTIIDVIWYSTDAGSTWTSINVADGTSGTYTITGLSVGTTYHVKTRVRSKASQLTADTASTTISTYGYPYADVMPNFTIGASVKITLSNPMSRTVTVQLRAAGGTVAGTATTSGTSVTITPTAATLYSSIPNSKTGTYTVRVTYNGNNRDRTGGTYSADPKVAKPTITAVTYEDTVSRIISVTQNDQLIVQGKSRVEFTASGLSGYNGSTIASASLTVNGTTHAMTIDGITASVASVTINSPSDVTATVTITDSRGITATKSVTVTMLEYKEPVLSVSAVRKNNFYSETDIKADAIISSVNGHNSATISYQVAQEGGSYGTWTDIASGTTYTVNLDNQYAWTVRFRVRDSISSNVYYYIDVAVGMPILFIDRALRSLGINCFPKYEGSVEADGHDLRKSVVSAFLSADISSASTSSYTQITLDGSTTFGTRLSVTNDGGVLIGEGVSKVLVSARIAYHAAGAGLKYTRIYKNSYSANNSIDWASQSLDANEYGNVVISQTLVDVQEGDVLYLYYYTTTADTIIGSATGGKRTSMTVEFVG